MELSRRKLFGLMGGGVAAATVLRVPSVGAMPLPSSEPPKVVLDTPEPRSDGRRLTLAMIVRALVVDLSKAGAVGTQKLGTYQLHCDAACSLADRQMYLGDYRESVLRPVVERMIKNIGGRRISVFHPELPYGVWECSGAVWRSIGARGVMAYVPGTDQVITRFDIMVV